MKIIIIHTAILREFIETADCQKNLYCLKLNQFHKKIPPSTSLNTIEGIVDIKKKIKVPYNVASRFAWF